MISSEQSVYEAGSNVNESVDGSDTGFEDSFISNGTDDLTSVVSTDKQQNISVGLMFEGHSALTLPINTNIRVPRVRLGPANQHPSADSFDRHWQ